jgi:REP element-mobilizing transposase RayT
MPGRLKRIYGFHDLHFITCSCYRRLPLLGTRHARDVFLRIFEQVRRKYKFEVVGFVVMPEHFHTLIGEPEKGNPSTVLQSLKQTVAKRLLKPARKRRNNQPMMWKERLPVQNRHLKAGPFTSWALAEKLNRRTKRQDWNQRFASKGRLLE